MAIPGIEGNIIDYELRSNFQSPSQYFVKFLYYEDIEGGVDAVYEEQSVRGRSEEHVFYSHTSGVIDNFSIRLPASVDEKDSGNAEKSYKDFLFIKSFNYPDYGINRQGPVLPPRKAIITIGKFYKEVGIIKGLSYTFSRTCDFLGYPLVIDVRFAFRVINAKPQSLQDIRGKKTYSGL
jgi:hypothetical protein